MRAVDVIAKKRDGGSLTRDEISFFVSGVTAGSLPDYQGNAAWMLPIPATFVVGRDGFVKARFVDPDFRRRMAVEELIGALKAAG